MEALNGDLLPTLQGDPCKFTDVLYALMKSQADELKVTVGQFGDAMDGDTLDLAWEAFCEALVNFSPSDRRNLLKMQIAKIKEMKQQAIGRIQSFLATGEFEKALAKSMDKKEDDVLAMLGNLSGNAPESSA